MDSSSASMNDLPHPWRQHLDAGAACEHSGMTDQALVAYGDALEAATTPAERAEAHVRVACLQRTRSQWDDVRKHATIALELAHECGSDDLAAEAINVEVGMHILRGELDDAAVRSERALTLCRSPRLRGITLQNQGTIAGRRGDMSAARARLEESIAAFREVGYELGITYSLVNLAVVAQDAGELNRALDLGNKAIAASRAIQADNLLLTAVQNQAHVMVRLGWFDKAQTMLTEAFGFFTTARNVIRQAECLEIMGELNSMRGGDPETAIRSFSRAKELAEKSGDMILTERIGKKLKKLTR